MSTVMDMVHGEKVGASTSMLENHTEQIDSSTDWVDENLVYWDGHDDRENARLMPTFRKWIYTAVLCSATLGLTILSSAWSTAEASIQEHFGSSHEVTILGVAMFVLGFGLAPPFIVAPLSEVYGRRLIYIYASAGYIAFQFPTAFGKNIATLIIGRVFTALCGSVFLSNVPGSISDMFTKEEQSNPMLLYPVGAFIGPTLGPMIGGFINYNLGFRWVFYILLIVTAVTAILVVMIPETYEPILLARKANRLRESTGNPDLYAPFEKTDLSALGAIKGNCLRPIHLFLLDPMMTLLCFYTGFLIAIVYFFFVAFPLVFHAVYDFNIWQVGLAFLGVSVGMGISVVTSLVWRGVHAKAVKANNGIAEPEMRLPQMCVGAVIVPIGMFMFAWTLYPSVHWIVPVIAGGVFGFGCCWTFSAIVAYTSEAYKMYAASAMGANVLLRGLVAFTFPLFGDQLLNALGFHWGVSLIGFVSVALAPSAFLLHKYGKVLRAKSRFANN